MHILGFLGVAAMALIVVGFFIGGVVNSFQNFGSGFPQNSGYPYSEEQIASAQKGLVAGASAISTVVTGETITSTLTDLSNTSRFRELFIDAKGSSFLVEPTLYTLFVPTDEAFAKLPYHEQVALNTMNDEELKRFVTYHLVPQKMVAVGGQKAGVVTAISRDVLNFELRDNGGSVGNAQVVAIYHVDNGIVYVIDQVLLPPTPREEPALRDFYY